MGKTSSPCRKKTKFKKWWYFIQNATKAGTQRPHLNGDWDQQVGAKFCTYSNVLLQTGVPTKFLWNTCAWTHASASCAGVMCFLFAIFFSCATSSTLCWKFSSLKRGMFLQRGLGEVMIVKVLLWTALQCMSPVTPAAKYWLRSDDIDTYIWKGMNWASHWCYTQAKEIGRLFCISLPPCKSRWSLLASIIRAQVCNVWDFPCQEASAWKISWLFLAHCKCARWGS